MQLSSLGYVVGSRPRNHTSVSLPIRFSASNQPATTTPFYTQIARGLRNGVLLSGLLWGGAYAGSAAYNHIKGDGPIPGFKSIAQSHKEAIKRNTTRHDQLSINMSSDQLWKKLQPTLALAKATSPQMYQWLQETYENNRLKFSPETKMVGVTCHEGAYSTAEYDRSDKSVTLNPEFLALTDGEKVAHLAFNYRIHLQNRGKVFQASLSPVQVFHFCKEKLSNCLPGGLTSQNPLDNEALLYEQQAEQALGISDEGTREQLKLHGLLPEKDSSCHCN